MSQDGVNNRATDAYFGLYLLAMRSGRPRRIAEIAAALKAAGFEAVKCHRGPTTLQLAVLTARKPDLIR